DVLLLHVSRSFFFFFQAEDGIRDFHVTGVQTCALPILAPASRIRCGVRYMALLPVSINRQAPAVPRTGRASARPPVAEPRSAAPMLDSGRPVRARQPSPAPA